MPSLSHSLSNKILYAFSTSFFNFIGHLLTPDWDKRLLGLRSLPIKTVIDIGANEGQFSQKLQHYFPQASFYAFEPLPLPYQKLSHWAKKSPQQILTFNLALGEKEEVIEMNNHLYFHPSSSILPTTALCEAAFPMVKKQEKITIQQSTLDQQIVGLNHCLKADILLKLDVQGYEDRVIQGGQATFKQARACIIEVSLDRLYENQAQFRDIFYA
ncbi:MAG: FkbM family methyltransferase [Microcystaceae cyanobacterium]